MKNRLCILEFPSNLGLKEPSPGHEPGVRQLPDFLRAHGLHAALAPESILRLEPPPYSMQLDEASGVRNADRIAAYASAQSDVLKEALAEDMFPIVIGGDCSILIGNAWALRNQGTYGLFFLDGHTDFMLPSLSQTGGAAGMDLAIITGHGHDKLVNIDGQKPYFREEQVWCVGNRCLDKDYVKVIQGSAIHYVDLDAVRQKGMEKIVSDFLHMVREEQLDGFWIHIDVDVLNDEIMPAVDSRQPDGLDYTEFTRILKGLLADERATGLNITILDPDLDPSGKHTREFVRHFCALFGRGK